MTCGPACIESLCATHVSRCGIQPWIVYHLLAYNNILLNTCSWPDSKAPVVTQWWVCFHFLQQRWCFGCCGGAHRSSGPRGPCAGGWQGACDKSAVYTFSNCNTPHMIPSQMDASMGCACGRACATPSRGWGVPAALCAPCHSGSTTLVTVIL